MAAPAAAGVAPAGLPPREWATAMARLGALVLDKLPPDDTLDAVVDAVAELVLREWRERGAPMSPAAVDALAYDTASLTTAVVLAYRDRHDLEEAAAATIAEDAPA